MPWGDLITKDDVIKAHTQEKPHLEQLFLNVSGSLLCHTTASCFEEVFSGDNTHNSERFPVDVYPPDFN